MSETAKYYKMADDLGDAPSMDTYASLSIYGDGVPQNKCELIFLPSMSTYRKILLS